MDRLDEPMGRKEGLLLMSTLPPLLLFFLILTFDRHSFSSGLLHVAALHPVCCSLFFIGALPLLRDGQLRRLDIAFIVFSFYGAVLFASVSRPSFPLDIGLYLSLLVWKTLVGKALDLPPRLSSFFSVYTVASLVLHSLYKAYPVE